MRSTAANAELALALEVASTPKPGNVDRHREYPDLRFEHFLAGAVGTREGFRSLVDGAPVGQGFLEAIEGMAAQRGGNTQFGAVLLMAPLVAAAGAGADSDSASESKSSSESKSAPEVEPLSPESASAVVAETTVEDAAAFYRAFEYVDVAVADPPADMEALDVRRGAAAIPALRSRELTLGDVMDRSALTDGVAREWVAGFERTFDAAARIADRDGPVTDRAAQVFLELLAEEADTFVRIQHDDETAAWVRDRAAAARDGAVDPEELADEFVAREINPGTTADIVAGALFVALERGLAV